MQKDLQNLKLQCIAPKKERHRRGNPNSRRRQDRLSPLVPRGRVNCLCPGSDDGVMMGKGGRRGQRSYRSLSERERGASRLVQVSLWTPPPPHTHLLSQRFRNCRLRPDHPQEGKQALISALQGPALSPGLSPLHTTQYTLHTTHKLPDHLTSPLFKS